MALGIALVAMFPALSPQPAFGQGLDDESVAALPVIEMVNFAYDPVVVEAGTDAMYRARLVNPSDAPHTFTIEAIGLEVYVPTGRWAVLELAEDDLAGAPLAVICTIGDHLALGMAGVVEVAARPGDRPTSFPQPRLRDTSEGTSRHCNTNVRATRLAPRRRASGTGGSARRREPDRSIRRPRGLR